MGLPQAPAGRVECAIALQKAFTEWNDTQSRDPRPSTLDPLLVRVGLNAGEPIEEDGDLFGATVILASRIAAKAGATAGQRANKLRS